MADCVLRAEICGVAGCVVAWCVGLGGEAFLATGLTAAGTDEPVVEGVDKRIGETSAVDAGGTDKVGLATGEA
jgi:hypothetical protein